MKKFLLVIGALAAFVPSSFAQMTFPNYASYCKAGAEISSATLVARINGISKSQAKDLMQGMTDPVAIRMVEEVIEFAYSRPATMGLEKMREELRTLCMARKMFVQ